MKGFRYPVSIQWQGGDACQIFLEQTIMHNLKLDISKDLQLRRCYGRTWPKKDICQFDFVSFLGLEEKIDLNQISP